MQISDLGLSAQNPSPSSLVRRPRGRPPVNLDGAQVVALRDEDGLSWNVIAKLLGVGATTVRRAYQYAKRVAESALPDQKRCNNSTEESIDTESARGLKCTI